MQLDCNGKVLDITHTQVMGILNVTPDSFSDGGRHNTVDKARMQSLRMIEEGAAIIDVGGESTRPGAMAVSVQEELDRVLPVIEVICKDSDVIISIDTSKPAVMREAIRAGASMINDVSALSADGAVHTAAELNVPVCLMHMQGSPRTMQDAPNYYDVTAQVRSYLLDRVRVCEEAGISRAKLVIDPGIGFGKSLEHNLTLIHDIDKFVATGLPVLIGVSRKSMIDKLLDVPVEERLAATVALEALAVMKGARLIRAHDVKEAVHAARMAEAVTGMKD